MLGSRSVRIVGDAMNKLLQIMSQFAIDGSPVDFEYLSGWHSCRTYICRTTCEKKHRRYVLQEINKTCFPSPELLMDNIVRVTGHLQKKLYEQGVWDPHRRSLVVVPAVDGQWYLRDQDSRYWRMYRHVEDSVTVEKPANCQQIYQASLAFGEFLAHLADLQDTLYPVIPDYHDGIKQMKVLKAAAQKDPFTRVGRVGAQLSQIEKNTGIFTRLQHGMMDSSLPLRTTHNDCRMNNVLLDARTAERVCVIGLDRVMPGLAAYDFGYLVSSLAGEFPDNEHQLIKAELRMDRFEAIAKGFIKGAGMMLTAVEKECLIPGAQVISLLVAVRSLTHYLTEPADSLIATRNHELLRCCTQLRLLNSIGAKEQSLSQIIKTLN